MCLPGGYSTWVSRDHTHMVMIFRGKAVLLKDEPRCRNWVILSKFQAKQFISSVLIWRLYYFLLVNRSIYICGEIYYPVDELMSKSLANQRILESCFRWKFWILLHERPYCFRWGLVIWFSPLLQSAVNRFEGWHLLAIFTATIVAFILRPRPTGILLRWR